MSGEARIGLQECEPIFIRLGSNEHRRDRLPVAPVISLPIFRPANLLHLINLGFDKVFEKEELAGQPFLHFQEKYREVTRSDITQWTQCKTGMMGPV